MNSTNGEEEGTGICHSCTIQGVAEEDLHNGLCFRCCAESGTGCQICNAKVKAEDLLTTFEPYSSYLERTNWINGDLLRAKEAAEKGDKELARAILALAAKNVAVLNEKIILDLLEHYPQ